MDPKLRFHTLFISDIPLLSSATSFSCHPSGPHLWLFDAYVNHNLSFLCSMLFLAPSVLAISLSPLRNFIFYRLPLTQFIAFIGSIRIIIVYSKHFFSSLLIYQGYIPDHNCIIDSLHVIEVLSLK